MGSYTFDSMSYKGETIRAQRSGGISEQDARDFVASRAPRSLAAEKARDPMAAWLDDAQTDGFEFTGTLWHGVIEHIGEDGPPPRHRVHPNADENRSRGITAL